MEPYVSELIGKVNQGKFDRKQLENLHRNAVNREGAEELALACEETLATMPKTRRGLTNNAAKKAAELSRGYSIIPHAVDEEGNLYKPELETLAKGLASVESITEITILKTQIKFHFQDEDFSAGAKSKGQIFWISMMDEVKLKPATEKSWSEIGTVKKGSYYSTSLLNIEFTEVEQVQKIMDSVVFI